MNEEKIERTEEQKDNIELFCYQIMVAINEIKDFLKEQKKKIIEENRATGI
jgi:hypothetical protein